VTSPVECAVPTKHHPPASIGSSHSQRLPPIGYDEGLASPDRSQVWTWMKLNRASRSFPKIAHRCIHWDQRASIPWSPALHRRWPDDSGNWP